MRTSFAALLLLLANLLAAPAFAQMAADPVISRPGPGMGSERSVASCANAPSPEQCETRRKARLALRAKAQEKCRGATGPERRQCMSELMIAQQDCATARHPERCRVLKTAYEGCRDQAGPALRQCMRDRADTTKNTPAKP